MLKSFQRIGIVAAATALSRVLGLARDILVFAVFGASGLNSAFLFAFTLPNLFRRLLGEGALVAAVVPVFSEELEERGKGQAWPLVNQVLTFLLLATVVLAVGSIALFLIIPSVQGLPARWYESAGLAVYLFPYVVFVCLAAVLGAALNVLNRFAVPALTAVWLNLAMIVFLGGFGMVLAETPEKRMLWLCYGVLFGGFLQLLAPFLALMREGWRPAPDLRWSSRLREISVLMLPGLAGTAIFQVNVIVSRSLAFTLDESAVAILYLANRLMEFPLGIFTIAVATVVFPELARRAVRGDFFAFGEAYRKGMLLILLITCPAAAGIFVLADPILSLLFQWGAFDAAATRETVPVLAVFALTLPLYSAATFATRGFHSLKDTATPVRIAGVSFLINLAASLILMQVFGAVGLALANLISVLFQSVVLQVRFQRRRPACSFRSLGGQLARIAVATLVMAVSVAGGRTVAVAWLGDSKVADALILASGIPAGAAVYFVLVFVLRVEGRDEAMALLRRAWRREPQGPGARDEDRP